MDFRSPIKTSNLSGFQGIFCSGFFFQIFSTIEMVKSATEIIYQKDFIKLSF